MTAENNPKNLVIGLDSSTTSTKALAIDKHGRIEAYTKAALDLHSPQPGYYEQNADDWWHAAQTVLRVVTQKINPAHIAALAISNQRETFVPLAENGQPLRDAIVWLDERCKSEVEPFSELVGKEKIHNISGKPVDFAPVVYRLAWMKKHEPHLFKQIAKVCDVHTYLTWKLTDAFATSWASADPLGMFAIENKEWSADILFALGMQVNQFPQTLQPGSIIGTVSEMAAEQTGLLSGTPIIAGGGDGQAAGLGSNVLTPDRAYLNLGTAVVAGVYGHKPEISKAFRTMCACSEDGYYYECSLRAGTFAIDWFIKNILKIEPATNPDIYNQLEIEARQTPIGSSGLLFLPYLNGVMNPYWNGNATGAFIGLMSSHQRGHMYRAILEGIAFEQTFVLQEVEQHTGGSIQELVVIGGGSANRFWCQMMADITGKRILIPQETEASALGVAISAAVGAGWYENTKVAAREMTAVKETIAPNGQAFERYLQFYLAYAKVYPALAPVNSILAGT
ncbi:FGGY-family carbohydrate kinase [candidate division KSB1 bacterium]|nr:FGGY-family carbohydrate kinase [candidate division KSB1 bacterium]